MTAQKLETWLNSIRLDIGSVLGYVAS